MTNTLENLIIDRESTNRIWNQLTLLRSDTINLICDASTAFRTTSPKSTSEASVAGATASYAIVYFDNQIHDFTSYLGEPIPINSTDGNFSEFAAILVGLEALYKLNIKRPSHMFLNIFNDNVHLYLHLRSVFKAITLLKQQGLASDSILKSLHLRSEIEQVLAYYIIELGLDTNLYHLKSHTNNMTYIMKDFINFNGFSIDYKELVYLSSIHSMVDSQAIKTNKNMI